MAPSGATASTASSICSKGWTNDQACRRHALPCHRARDAASAGKGLARADAIRAPGGMADAERFRAEGRPPLQFPRPADAALERRHDCQVLAVEPNRRLSYTWNASDAEAANGLKTVVTWTLTPIKGGVLVRMEQSGFRADEEANYCGANYGWQKYVAGLSAWPSRSLRCTGRSKPLSRKRA
jgi:uncharacterized protein YndB with AHSA1/START domain